MTEILPAPANSLVAAIAAVMTEVHSVAKDGVNQFHGYRYATMGNLLREITPLLGRHGLVIFQTETGRAMFDGENIIAVEYAFTVAHSSGERWPEPLKQTGVSRCRDSKGGWDDKSLAKCHTAARKYFLLSLFQIPTGEEADADAGELDHVERRRVSVSRPRPAPRMREAATCNATAASFLERPRTVAEAPRRKLEADRRIDTRYENVIRYDQIQPRIRRTCEAEMVKQETLPAAYNELNPPPLGDIPDFLDRRPRDRR